ncbi:MAG: hypothetical protein HRU35_01810 [Rickettsiaceae bacterium]|nr:hypothetical protein [Rickettsiaceae bacterium]
MSKSFKNNQQKYGKVLYKDNEISNIGTPIGDLDQYRDLLSPSKKSKFNKKADNITTDYRSISSFEMLNEVDNVDLHLNDAKIKDIKYIRLFTKSTLNLVFFAPNYCIKEVIVPLKAKVNIFNLENGNQIDRLKLAEKAKCEIVQDFGDNFYINNLIKYVDLQKNSKLTIYKIWNSNQIDKNFAGTVKLVTMQQGAELKFLYQPTLQQNKFGKKSIISLKATEFTYLYLDQLDEIMQILVYIEKEFYNFFSEQCIILDEEKEEYTRKILVFNKKATFKIPIIKYIYSILNPDQDYDNDQFSRTIDNENFANHLRKTYSGFNKKITKKVFTNLAGAKLLIEAFMNDKFTPEKIDKFVKTIKASYFEILDYYANDPKTLTIAKKALTENFKGNDYLTQEIAEFLPINDIDNIVNNVPVINDGDINFYCYDIEPYLL